MLVWANIGAFPWQAVLARRVWAKRTLKTIVQRWHSCAVEQAAIRVAFERRIKVAHDRILVR